MSVNVVVKGECTTRMSHCETLCPQTQGRRTQTHPSTNTGDTEIHWSSDLVFSTTPKRHLVTSWMTPRDSTVHSSVLRTPVTRHSFRSTSLVCLSGPLTHSCPYRPIEKPPFGRKTSQKEVSKGQTLQETTEDVNYLRIIGKFWVEKR